MALSRRLHPAQLWPPERTETRHPFSIASFTASTTSCSLLALTTARGYLFARRRLNILPTRASSYSGSEDFHIIGKVAIVDVSWVQPGYGWDRKRKQGKRSPAK